MISYSKSIFYSALLLLIIGMMLLLPACKKEKETDSPDDSFDDVLFDALLSQQDLATLENASVNYEDYVDSLRNINGSTYQSLFMAPNWSNLMDSIRTSLRTTEVSIGEQIKTDLSKMLEFGGGLIYENTLSSKVRPELGFDEPAQQAYAYLQIPSNLRQLKSRVKPSLGNEIYKQYKLLGTDASGYLYFLLKSAGFPNCNFIFNTGDFQTKIAASVTQKYSNNARLINMGDLQLSEIKKGDFMVTKGYGAIIDKAGNALLAYQSNGTSQPISEADHRKNFEYDGVIVKRGISAKDFGLLKAQLSTPISIYRILPVIDKGEIVSGNIQHGFENQTLSEPLKMKVLDKLGYGVEDAKVIFSVISGEGQIIGNQEVKTNEEGIAQVTWKMGTKSAGVQKIVANIIDFSGNQIENGSIVFKATLESGCGNDKSISDIDGNIYPIVQIGNQCWMAENLNTTHYADESIIPNITANEEWITLNSGAWCNLNNDETIGQIYEKLYNWLAVSDSRNVCPDGWHVASDPEWKELEMFLGMTSDQVWNNGYEGSGVNIGGQLKTTSLWATPNFGALNSVGFSALPGGFRASNNGDFLSHLYVGHWWTATSSSGVWIYSREIYNESPGRSREIKVQKHGYSIRCVKD